MSLTLFLYTEAYRAGLGAAAWTSPTMQHLGKQGTESALKCILFQAREAIPLPEAR